MALDPISTDTLIAGRYVVDPARPLQGVGGGVPTFQAIDGRSGDGRSSDGRQIALAVGRYAGPRLAALQAFDDPIDDLMVPLGHGIGPKPGGGQGYYVICTAPPGPLLPVGPDVWSETLLLEHVLRPAARVLTTLHDMGLTHRAIRPNNVFAATRGQPVTLGAAWATPPAMLQPAVCESPYSAICCPAGRGDGTIADDVYALGVLLVVLATGKVPMAGLDDASIILRKFDLGSFAALTAGAVLPPFLSDLLRGMLADDPEHRSNPKLLTDPSNARTRRVVARPSRRSQRPLMVNDVAVFDARTLAYALSTDEKKSLHVLRNGVVSQWLRRGLADAGLATLIEDLVRIRQADSRAGPDADPLLLMQTISTIEPHMPLCWRETASWPDAIGTLLAEGLRGSPSLMAAAEELLRNDVLSIWSAVGARRGRNNVIATSPEGRQLQLFLLKGGEGASLRAFYTLNPLLPCAVPAMAELWILDMAGLMRFLEKAASAGPSTNLIDLHMRAFIAARGERHFDTAVNLVLATKDPKMYRMRELALLRDLQHRYHMQPMPALAAWVAAQLRPDLEAWQNQRTRAALIERLADLAQAGFLARLLSLVEDDKGLAEDAAGAQRAAMLVVAIDSELAALARSDNTRRVVTARFGREIAAAIGLTALILMMLSAAFG